MQNLKLHSHTFTVMHVRSQPYGAVSEIIRCTRGHWHATTVTHTHTHKHLYNIYSFIDDFVAACSGSHAKCGWSNARFANKFKARFTHCCFSSTRTCDSWWWVERMLVWVKCVCFVVEEVGEHNKHQCKQPLCVEKTTTITNGRTCDQCHTYLLCFANDVCAIVCVWWSAASGCACHRWLPWLQQLFTAKLDMGKVGAYVHMCKRKHIYMHTYVSTVI